VEASAQSEPMLSFSSTSGPARRTSWIDLVLLVDEIGVLERLRQDNRLFFCEDVKIFSGHLVGPVELQHLLVGLFRIGKLARLQVRKAQTVEGADIIFILLEDLPVDALGIGPAFLLGSFDGAVLQNQKCVHNVILKMVS
jgi:hypothetical protein